MGGVKLYVVLGFTLPHPVPVDTWLRCLHTLAAKNKNIRKYTIRRRDSGECVRLNGALIDIVFICNNT